MINHFCITLLGLWENAQVQWNLVDPESKRKWEFPLIHPHSINPLISSPLAIFLRKSGTFIKTKKTVCYVQVFEFVQFTGCYYALYICEKILYNHFKKVVLGIGRWVHGSGCNVEKGRRLENKSNCLTFKNKLCIYSPHLPQVQRQCIIEICLLYF